MNPLLDAQDQIVLARNLNEMFLMACRNNPDDDEKAISALADEIRMKLDRAQELLDRVRDAELARTQKANVATE